MSPESRNTYWNAAVYDGISDPQFEWGMAVLNTVELQGSERVIDAGCGSGRLTEELLKRLPSGHVVAIDSSPQMLEQARRRLEAYGSRVQFVEASLQHFGLPSPVDGIFSNAVFHWVPDHGSMFRCLHRALVPGGWLVAQFGGIGNLERTHRRADEVAAMGAFRELLPELHYGPHFEDVPSTRARMEAAGFVVQEAKLHSVQPRFEHFDRYDAFLRTVVLRNVMAKLPEGLQGKFLEEMSRLCVRDEGGYVLDHVRLTVRARS
jgi:trans-aconitate 2-methyltransferase